MLQIIGDVADDRIPSVARFCLDLLPRQYLTLVAAVSSIGKRLGQRIFECLLTIGTRSAQSIMASGRTTGRTRDPKRT